MERKGRIWSKVLIFIVHLTCLSGCSLGTLTSERVDVEIQLNTAKIDSKAAMPDEEKITDVNLLIFDERGYLEKHIRMTGGQSCCTAKLLKGVCYSIYACANFGYEVCINKLEDIPATEFHLAYPDEYKEGIPMSAVKKNIRIEESGQIGLELERLMAKISLKIDRSLLSEGVNMDVTSLCICNCPKKVKVFSQSKAESEDDCFKAGFIHKDTECSGLNHYDIQGLSDEISVYMLENMQGEFSDQTIVCDEEKIFQEKDPRSKVCSYIEVGLEYRYEDKISNNKPLIYRFYLGEDLNNLDIERNSHYHITICPEDDGLKGDGWRVDKSGIISIVEPSLSQYPGDYIVGDIGDKIHIGCILSPSDAPFDIGRNYLDADKEVGIYDYEIDKDGHGVTLTLTGPGRGLIYMEAGDPINDAALFIIEVNLP